MSTWRGLRLHRRAAFLVATLVVGVVVLVQLELLGPAFVLLYWAWFALIGGGILFASVRWIAHAEARGQVREFVAQSWRELFLAGVVALVIGEVARADDLGATAFLAGLAFLFVLPAVGFLVERTAVGQRFHSLSPRWFLVAVALIYLTGPQFVREMPTDNCDEPAYWVQTDYNENDYGGGRAVYSCYDPGVEDFVAPRVEGRSLFGLRLSHLGLRLYSLNFTDSRFRGIEVCAEDADCFP